MADASNQSNDSLITNGKYSISGETYQKSFFKKMNELRKSALLCDVVVMAEGGKTKFPVHRVVLAASSGYFHRLYTGTCLTRYCRETVLGGISEDILQIMLDYIYTSEIELDADKITSFLHASFYLELKAVKEECEAFLLKQLKTDNCILMMTLGKHYSCAELLKEAQLCIGDNFLEIRSSEAFLKLPADYILEIIADDDLDVNKEEQVYEAVSAWVRYDLQQRSGEFPALLRRVRLPFTSRKFLGSIFDKDPLVTSSQHCKDIVGEALTFKMAGHKDREPFRGERTSKRWKTQLMETIALVGGITEDCGITQPPNHCYNPRTNKWYSLAPLTESRLNFGLTQLNRWLYAIGGSSIDESMNILASVERLCPRLNKWEQVAPLQRGRMKFESVELHSKFYAIGGILSGEGLQHIVECYDYLANTWTPVRPPRQLRHTHCAVSFDGHLYIIGGISQSNTVLDTIEKYDPREDKWTSVTAMSTPRSGSCAVVLQHKIYVLGGSGRRGALNSCEVYDGQLNKWTNIKEMNVKRDRAGAAEFGGKIYVFGGSYGNVAVDSVERFDPSKGVWDLVTELPCARHGFRSMAAVVSKDIVEEIPKKKKTTNEEKLI